VKRGFVRPFIILRDGVELNDLAEFVDQDIEQIARFFLRPDGGRDPKQGLVAFRCRLI
jgi:hypothetical protein